MRRFVETAAKKLLFTEDTDNFDNVEITRITSIAEDTTYIQNTAHTKSSSDTENPDNTETIENLMLPLQKTSTPSTPNSKYKNRNSVGNSNTGLSTPTGSEDSNLNSNSGRSKSPHQNAKNSKKRINFVPENNVETHFPMNKISKSTKFRNEMDKTLEEISKIKKEIDCIVAKADENPIDDSIREIQEARDKLKKLKKYHTAKIDLAVNSALKSADTAIEKVYWAKVYWEKQKIAEIHYQIENITKQVEEINNIEKQSPILNSLKKIYHELQNISSFSDTENYGRLQDLDLKRIEDLVQKLHQDQESTTICCNQLQHIKGMISICTDSKNTEISKHLDNLQKYAVDKIHNRGTVKMFTEEIMKCAGMLQRKLNELQDIDAKTKIVSVRSQLNDIAYHIKEYNFVDDQEKVKYILTALTQNEQELSLIKFSSNLNNLQEFKDLNLVRINVLTDRIYADRKRFTEINNELEEIRVKIENFAETSEHPFFKETKISLQKIRTTVIDKIFNTHYSTILTNKANKCLENLMHATVEEGEKGNISHITLQLTDIAKQIDIIEKQLKEDENITNISEAIKQKEKELVSITVPKTMETLKESVLNKIKELTANVNENQQIYEENHKKLEEINKKIEKFADSSEGAFLKEMEFELKSIPHIITYKIHNKHFLNTLIAKTEKCSKLLKSKQSEKVRKEISTISLQVDNIERQLKEGENLTKTLESLSKNEKELVSIDIPTNMDSLKRPLLNRIEILSGSVKENQKTFEEINNKLKETKRKIDDFSGSSTDTFFNELNIELNNIQDTINHKVFNTHFSETLTMKRENCLKLLESKLKQIESIEAASRIISIISSDVDERIVEHYGKGNISAKNDSIMNEIEEKLAEIEVKTSTFFGLPTDTQYFTLKTEIEGEFKKLKDMQMDQDSERLKKRHKKLIDDIDTILTNLQQRSFHMESIEQIEKSISVYEKNVEESGQQMSDYEKEDIEDELLQIRNKLERIPAEDKLQKRRSTCLERIKKIYIILAEEEETKHDEISETETMLIEIETKFADIQNIIMRYVNTSHSEGIVSLEAKLTKMLSKVNELDLDRKKELQERKRFLTDNIKENSQILQRNYQKICSKTDKIKAAINEDEISSVNSIKQLGQSKSAKTDNIDKNFEKQKRSLTDTIKENTPVLRKLPHNHVQNNRIGKTAELTANRNDNEDFSATTTEFYINNKEIENIRTNTKEMYTKQPKNTVTNPKENSLNELEENFSKVQNSINNLFGESSMVQFTNLNTELTEILSRLNQLELGNNNEDLLKRYTLLKDKVSESECSLKERAADLRNLTRIEKEITAHLKDSRIITDFEKETLEDKLKEDIYQLERIRIDGVEERKKCCTQKINDILRRL